MVRMAIKQNYFEIIIVNQGEDAQYFLNCLEAQNKYSDFCLQYNQSKPLQRKVIVPDFKIVNVKGDIKQYIHSHLLDINILIEDESMSIYKVETEIDSVIRTFYVMDWIELEKLKADLKDVSGKFSSYKIEVKGNVMDYFNENSFDKVR